MQVPIMKMMLNIAIAIVVSLLAGACTPKITEVARVPSPNGLVDAVSAARETDATVATPTEIYLAGRGQSIEGAPVFRADKVVGLRLTWDGDAQLVIYADVARVFLYSPQAEVEVSGAGKKPVDVRLDIKDRR
ncbi:exported hypothetical protein [Ralstonia solanacearum K60]|nr:exported hypothetical protein [Ralstonia solanacearum K60]